MVNWNKARIFIFGVCIYSFMGAAHSNLIPLEEAMESAEAGDPAAQIELGRRYDKGEGVSKNREQAIAWYRKAAEQGDAVAQRHLGVMYDLWDFWDFDLYMDADPDDIPNYDAEAVAWYNKAAEQGDAVAQRNLGNMYKSGRGVAKSSKLAIAWYRKAAEQGVASAQTALGEAYEYGIEVTKDTEKAVAWYRKAAERGDFFAKEKLDPNKPFSFRVWEDSSAETFKSALFGGGAVVVANIDFSEDGKKRIYFSPSRDCEDSREVAGSQTDIWIFNDQPVRMSRFCNDSSPSFTPLSDQGLSFVVELFEKASSKRVMIDTGSVTFPVATMGFSREWSKSKNSAL